MRRAMRPQRRPKRDHRAVSSCEFLVSSWGVPMSRVIRAMRRMAVKRQVVMAMSQIQWTAYCMAAG